ncbi:ROK family protein [Williamsia phyllosphaerae]|uniref:ROK family protein n=1 Tax=Williamsia phyllosphaerae TaxID=885042 RepID=UPI0016651BD8|nr:ROK family protein [Williamsia phyllosphaerae]
MTGPVVLAVDVGGTKVEAALVDSTGSVHDGSRFRAPTGPTRSADELDAAVTGVIERVLDHRGGQRLVGVGVSCAGPVDERAGTVSPINLTAWRRHPLRDVVSDCVARRSPDVPVAFARDGVAIALAEHWVGAGRGVANMLGMVISTGIGGGMILGGRVIGGNAGHIGQIEVSEFTGELSLGRRTTLESVASGPHLVEWARTQGWTGSTGEDLARDRAAGDELADRAVVRLADAVGQGISSAAALLDIDLVVVGGGFARVAPDLVDLIGARVAQHPLDYVARVRVVAAGLGDTAPLVGAAAFIHRADLMPPAR